MTNWLAAKRQATELRAIEVSTKTGQTIKGALIEQHRDALILRAASVAIENAQGQINWHPLDGDTVIPMDNVDFWQDGLDATFLDGLVDTVARRAAG